MIYSAMAICFVAGLVIGGSDGDFFPWTILIGGAIFSLIVPLSYKVRGRE